MNIHKYFKISRLISLIDRKRRKVGSNSDPEGTYMKKKAVKTRPMASVITDRLGYIESGTGLLIGFGALHKWIREMRIENCIRNLEMKLIWNCEVSEESPWENECGDHNGRSFTFRTSTAANESSRWLSVSETRYSIIYISSTSTPARCNISPTCKAQNSSVKNWMQFLLLWKVKFNINLSIFWFFDFPIHTSVGEKLISHISGDIFFNYILFLCT